LLSGLETLPDFPSGRKPLCRALSAALGVRVVVLADCNSACEPVLLAQLGHAAARYITALLGGSMILAITGGAVPAALARCMPQVHKFSDLLVVSARASLCSELEVRANCVATALAERCRASYQLLQGSDITPDVVQSTPHNQSALNLLREADILVYDIGTSDHHALRRGLSMQQNRARHGTAECLGYALHGNGTPLPASHGLLSPADLERLPSRIAVAGGTHKAEAIVAACRWLPPHVLVVDTTAAHTILRTLS